MCADILGLDGPDVTQIYEGVVCEHTHTQPLRFNVFLQSMPLFSVTQVSNSE